MENNIKVIEIEKVIRLAGEMLINYQGQLSDLKIQRKKNEGLVSEADKETEKYLIEQIKRLHPDSEFIAEESSFDSKNKKLKNKKLHWLIDPLDGTNNFLSAFDYYAISVAAYIDDEVEHGWVYRPSTKEMFYSQRGKGSKYQKGSAECEFIKKESKNLSSSMLSTGFCVEKGQAFDLEFEIFKSVMGKCRGVRRLGSAALDLCYSALGPWDGFWERGLSPWDVAAGGLFAQEAGLIVTNYKGAKFSPFDDTIIAATNDAHVELVDIIGKI